MRCECHEKSRRVVIRGGDMSQCIFLKDDSDCRQRGSTVEAKGETVEKLWKQSRQKMMVAWTKVLVTEMMKSSWILGLLFLMGLANGWM